MAFPGPSKWGASLVSSVAHVRFWCVAWEKKKKAWFCFSRATESVKEGGMGVYVCVCGREEGVGSLCAGLSTVHSVT